MYLNVPMPAFEGGNKNPNGYYAKAFTIKSIKYPTGGSTVFEFEGHEFSAVNNNTELGLCGGIRIKSIKDSAQGYSPIERTFSYSGGVINVKPKPAIANPKACRRTDASDTYMGIVVGPSSDWLGFSNSQAYLWGYILSSSSINPIYSYNSDYIAYKMVTESNSDGSKTTYHYNSANDNYFTNSYSYQCGFHSGVGPTGSNVKVTGYIYSSRPVYPFTNHITGPLYTRGLLIKKESFNSDNKLVCVETFDYDHLEGATIYGNKVFKTRPYQERFFYLTAYEIHTGKSLLSKKSIARYDTLNSVQLYEEHFYEYYTDKELLKKQTTINSNGKVITTQQTYPFCYPDQTSSESQGNRTPIHSALVSMTRKNMNAYPVERLTLVNNSWKDGELNIYKEYSTGVFPLASYKYITGTPQTSSSAFDGRNENLTYFYKDLNFDFFDTYGNLLQYHREDDVPTSYIWGYNQTLPVAQIVNASLDQIAYCGFDDNGGNLNLSNWGNWQFLTGPNWYLSPMAKQGKSSMGTTSTRAPIRTVKTLPAGEYHINFYSKSSTVKMPLGTNVSISYDGSWYYYSGSITLSSPQKVQLELTNSVIDDLRLYPAGALVTTYTHDPLVGVTSQTDPNGRTTTYEYDGLGRLSLVRDHDGHILKKYDYHYAE
jgi:YD repeat-containing protein